jgi:hypothetical protein
MPRIRILALVAPVAIAASLLGSSIHACDDRSTACEHALTPSGPTPEAFAQRPTQPHRGHRPPHHVDPSPNVTALSVMLQAARAHGALAQQFQRFVSKQSITTSTAQQLRSPWLEPAQLAVTSAHSVSGGIITASDDDATNNLNQATANEVAVDNHNDLVDESRRAMGERRTAALQSRASDNGPPSVSWIGLGFLVWGGLLTVGSGLRLIFG